jgi:hypothetical protein
MRRIFSCLLGLTALLVLTPAHAQVNFGATTISGFGTLGGVYNSSEKYGYTRDIGQETTPGRQRSWETDSLIGIQVAHTFNREWQVVGQVVARNQVESTLNNAVTRAFVSFRPTDNLHLRLGRMADATFLMSDYADVGYVYPWVRPPMESYAIIAPHFYDGADITYSLRDAAGVWRIKGLAGRIEAPVPQTVHGNYMLKADDLWGLTLIREQGPLKLRIGYTSFHLKNPSVMADLLLPALDQVIANPLLNAYYPAVTEEARALRAATDSLPGSRVGFASAGFVYDDGQWMLQAEISNLSSDTPVFPKGQQGYASVGYHFGDFLPFVMLSGSRGPAAVRPVTSWGSLLGPAAGQLQAGTITSLNSPRSAQSTVSLGMRWDFDARAALKLQWDHVRVRENGWGLWTKDAADTGAPGRANVMSATLDFVF